jgi:hypothetical protein
MGSCLSEIDPYCKVKIVEEIDSYTKLYWSGVRLPFDRWLCFNYFSCYYDMTGFYYIMKPTEIEIDEDTIYVLVVDKNLQCEGKTYIKDLLPINHKSVPIQVTKVEETENSWKKLSLSTNIYYTNTVYSLDITEIGLYNVVWNVSANDVITVKNI